MQELQTFFCIEFCVYQCIFIKKQHECGTRLRLNGSHPNRVAIKVRHLSVAHRTGAVRSVQPQLWPIYAAHVVLITNCFHLNQKPASEF